MNFKHFLFDGTESVQSWLRVKQELDLAGKIYDYNYAYVTNVKGKDEELVVPIIVEDNKVTIEMTTIAPVLRNVEMYMFQDADNSQLHIYMPTASFVNYFANLEFTTLLTEGEIDPNDTAAVEKVFADMEARVESINVSFVFKARK